MLRNQTLALGVHRFTLDHHGVELTVLNLQEPKPNSCVHIMPVPRHIFEQLKSLIPPLNGSLHKGQSGEIQVVSGRHRADDVPQDVWASLVGHLSEYQGGIAQQNVK